MTTARRSGFKQPSMPFYGTAFFSSEHVRLMTWEQRGIYLFLLWYAWEEGSIPGDTKQLSVLAGARCRNFVRTWRAIQPCWVDRGDGRLVNERMEEVRQERLSFIESQRRKSAIAHGKVAPGHPNGQPAGGPSLSLSLSLSGDVQQQQGGSVDPAAEIQRLTKKLTVRKP